MSRAGRAWLWRVAAIVLAQLAYWGLLQPLLVRPQPPPPLATIVRVESARIAPSDPSVVQATVGSVQAAIAQASFVPDSTPWVGCCDPAQYVLRFTVTLDSVAAEGLGVLARLDADNAWLFVNGTFAAGTGRLEVAHPTLEPLRSAWFVPASLWHSGENTVDLVTVRATMPYTDVREPWVAPWSALHSSISAREFVFREYRWMGVAITGVLALLAFTLYARGGRTPALWWTGLLLAAWGGRLLLSVWATFPFPVAWRLPLVLGSELVLSLSWFGVADSWPGREPARWRRYAVAGAVGLALAAWAAECVLLTQWPAPDGFDLAARLHSIAGLLLVGSALAHMVQPLLGTPRADAGAGAAEAAVFSVLITLLGLDFWTELTTGTVGGNLSASLPLLFIAFAMAFAARNVRLFRSMREFNQLLDTRLAAREQELADGFAARQEVARQQALYEERTRIMRDMHDGIGGRLLSLVAQLRGAVAPAPSQVADEMIAALDELRLIVDSLDTAGDDLGLALGAFRTRMAPRLAAAGITLKWVVEDAAVEPALPASAILDLYRIMQEACANALRHAGASEFRVALVREADGTRVLTLADNGTGLTGARTGGHAGSGRGLSNMRQRAERLGGHFAIRDADPGTCVRVVLPPLPGA